MRKSPTGMVTGPAVRPDGQERYGQVRDWMTRAPATVDDGCPIGVALSRMRSAVHAPSSVG